MYGHDVLMSLQTRGKFFCDTLFTLLCKGHMAMVNDSSFCEKKSLATLTGNQFDVRF
jgi:hypothetical protein